MGQHQAKPLPQEQLPLPPPPAPTDGLLPRSSTARLACNPKRVRRLIKAGRLGPCWKPLGDGEEVCGCVAGMYTLGQPPAPGLPAPSTANRLTALLFPLQGHECPVCMEGYACCNKTACCHQDVCKLLPAGRLPWHVLFVTSSLIAISLSTISMCAGTECFISIVAPTGGVGARCPYCQVAALQVYLPPADMRAECQEGSSSSSGQVRGQSNL